MLAENATIVRPSHFSREEIIGEHIRQFRQVKRKYRTSKNMASAFVVELVVSHKVK